jgi:hypothetical protein
MCECQLHSPAAIHWYPLDRGLCCECIRFMPSGYHMSYVNTSIIFLIASTLYRKLLHVLQSLLFPSFCYEIGEKLTL